MGFSGSYMPDDVEFLLQPARIEPVDLATKEALIQSGAKHYSEMYSAEQVPDETYLALYRAALARNAGRVRTDIELLAQKLSERPETKASCTLVSLARAGTPIGVLLKRAMERRGIAARHYSISIIRGRGIDLNALRLIADRHGSADAVFIDGWTGKGAITAELQHSLARRPFGFLPYLAVVADPAGCASLAATCQDYLIPSGILNGIVSGLVSRSVLNDALVGPNDFHACQFQHEFAAHDLSRDYIAAIEAARPESACGVVWSEAQAALSAENCRALLGALATELGVSDRNRIKPGIAEATRAVLRRLPDAVLVQDLTDPEVQHLLHLADRVGITIVERNLGNYRAVSIIRRLGEHA